MHRVTERRWTAFFWILLSFAVVFQVIAFVAPAWLKVFINFEKYYNDNSTTVPKSIPVNQDYSLWYMTQCHVTTWTCETLSYYNIAFMNEVYDKTTFQEPQHWYLERTNLFLNGAELRFDYSVLSENQTEYTLGLLACVLAWWLVNTHRKRLRKKGLEKVTNTRLIITAITSSFSGLFVLIPVGRFGNMGDQLRSLVKDNPNDIAVHSPIGLGFGAAGGSLALMAGLVIGLRLVLRSYCPDCVDLPRHDEIAMRETGNQVDGVENSHRGSI